MKKTLTTIAFFIMLIPGVAWAGFWDAIFGPAAQVAGSMVQTALKKYGPPFERLENACYMLSLEEEYLPGIIILSLLALIVFAIGLFGSEKSERVGPHYFVWRLSFVMGFVTCIAFWLYVGRTWLWLKNHETTALLQAMKDLATRECSLYWGMLGSLKDQREHNFSFLHLVMDTVVFLHPYVYGALPTWIVGKTVLFTMGKTKNNSDEQLKSETQARKQGKDSATIDVRENVKAVSFLQDPKLPYRFCVPCGLAFRRTNPMCPRCSRTAPELKGTICLHCKTLAPMDPNNTEILSCRHCKKDFPQDCKCGAEFPMRFCESCGLVFNHTDSSCSSCATKLPQQLRACSQCKTFSTHPFPKCGKCGADLPPRLCLHCHTPANHSDPACLKCGKEIG